MFVLLSFRFRRFGLLDEVWNVFIGFLSIDCSGKKETAGEKNKKKCFHILYRVQDWWTGLYSNRTLIHRSFFYKFTFSFLLHCIVIIVLLIIILTIMKKNIIFSFFSLLFFVGTAHALTLDDIELLIATGVIPSNNAEQARRVVSEQNSSNQAPTEKVLKQENARIEFMGEFFELLQDGWFDNSNLNYLCKDAKQLISKSEEVFDVDITCKNKKYSFAVELDFRDNGSKYCYDHTDVGFSRVSNYSGIKIKRGVLYCDYAETPFEEIKLMSDKVKESFSPFLKIDARKKGIDAAIKANLSNARAQAELYYDTNTSYKGVCKSKNGILASVDAVNELSKAICYDYVETWAMYAPLVGDKSVNFCVDSTGLAGDYKIKKSNGKAYCVK